jgi:XTP/dITP diphosphohydrolase
MPSIPLLVATFDPGKIREFHYFLDGLPVEVLGLSSFPVRTECVEDGKTFEENARKKAAHYSQLTHVLTLADDSGLLVDALGGEPGVYSARYLGEKATDQERYLSILNKLESIPEAGRTARFICCIALARQGEILQTFHGVVEGRIEWEARGENGFGYDPIFFVPELGKTMAELNSTEKLQVSHRGRALRVVSEYLHTFSW